MSNFDPIAIALVLGMMALAPLLVVTSTAFLKISAVLLILRNAIGVQQVPPNLVMYGISFVLTLLVMSPTFNKVANDVKQDGKFPNSAAAMIERSESVFNPMKEFMGRHVRKDYHDNFYATAQQFQARYGGASMERTDMAVLLPAFVTSELTAAFEIGLLLFLPFVIIDLVVSSVLMALGMMMVSPQTITLPLKIILFVAVEGWAKVLTGLARSYL